MINSYILLCYYILTSPTIPTDIRIGLVNISLATFSTVFLNVAENNNAK